MKYKVMFRIEEFVEVEVEADTPDEAEQLAMGRDDYTDCHGTETWETYSITENPYTPNAVTIYK